MGTLRLLVAAHIGVTLLEEAGARGSTMWMYLCFSNFTTQTRSEDAPPAAGTSPFTWLVTGMLFAVANWGRALVAQTGPWLNEQGARSAVQLGDGAPLPTAVEWVRDMLSSERSAKELPGARTLRGRGGEGRPDLC